MINAWNNIVTLERTDTLNERPDKASAAMKQAIIRDYYAYCKLKHCYSCETQRRIDTEATKLHLKRMEERRIKGREKAIKEEEMYKKCIGY